ncbi:MAG: hypothetical protein COV34_02260 [Candidatus Zambryskibacteria bacterium CG10_big_fil_rev_8_21_14_0_10_42_12]|uniref:Glutamyl-tRNA amidotransferase n=1 Tax=Candidatus Zambryskibacteria bacterium CG10_big_fil_rev_8_21_14_0_10_42_12 TaxID=1975115 RepID=A0A2H0QVZ0_9BACT|nr:MAG: hypothetical protein COV34_02260 [Candidatus Zambryskibacteria bacterium CG10_big_fil_rev_8_21_14_0_10_42_12]
MSIHEDIRTQMVVAMKAKDSVRLETLRGLISSFSNESVTLGRTPKDQLSDDEAIAVIKRAVKQRKEAIEQFRAGNREDLAENEEKELAVLNPLLPAAMPVEEIEKIAIAKQTELGLTDKSKMGILIGAVMKETAGKADGGDVKKIVENLF